MEATDAQKFADQITAGTKEIVEKTGKEYKPTPLEMLDVSDVSENEKENFGKGIADQIREGTKEAKKAAKLHEKTFGSKPGQAGFQYSVPN